MNKRQLGTTYEDKACEYLEQKGYKIIERNFNKKTRQQQNKTCKNITARSFSIQTQR